MKTRTMRWLVALMAIAVFAATGCAGSEEARKREHVAKGERFMAERNYAKARIEFRNALQIDPKDAQVRALVGLSNEKLEEYKDAVNAYLLALEVDETLEMPRARVALIYASAGLPEQAMEMITPGLERNPNSSALLTARAVATAQTDLEAARRDADEAARLDPKNEDAAAVLASLMWRVGERQEAVALLERTVQAVPESMDLRVSLARLLLSEGRLAEAEQHLQEVRRLDPDNVEHSFRLAQVYLTQGKTDLALDTLRAAVQAHPDDVDAKLGYAQLLVEYKSFAEGEKALRTYIEQDRKNLDLELGLGRFYEANRRTEEAVAIYRSLVKDAGERPQAMAARNRLAAISLDEGKLEETSRLVGEVLSENPRDGEALAVRAEIAMRKGQTDSAVADLRTAASDQPDSVPLAIALARAYTKAGQTELAEQALRSVIQVKPKDVQARIVLAQFLIETGRARQAEPVLEQIVAEQPSNTLALAGLAKVQLASGNVDAALQTAAGLQALEPSSTEGWELAGAALRSKQKLTEARAAYERAAEANPKAPEPVVLLAEMDILEKQPEKALARLEAARATMPGNALIEGARGDVLSAMGRHSEALESYRRAVDAMPGWAPAHLSLARSYSQLGDRSGAVTALERGFEATHGSSTIGVPLAMAYASAGRIDDGIAVYERILAAQPDDLVAANNLAMLLVDRKSDEASHERAEQLVRPLAFQDNPGFMDTYGWVLLKRGRHAEALEYLSKAVAKAPNSAEFRFHLGIAQLAAGKAAEGRSSLKKALELRSDFPGADDARKALAGM